MAKPDLRDNRKFLKLRRLLGEPTPHVIGYLECLWNRGYQTGNPVLGNELDVEAAAEYPGEPGKFAKAALEAGFLDEVSGGTYAIHELYDNAPQYVKKRMTRKGFAPKKNAAASRKKMDSKTCRTARDGFHSAQDGFQTARDGFHSAQDGFQTARDGFQTAGSGFHSERDGFHSAQSGLHNQEPRTKNQEPRTKNQEPEKTERHLAADAAEERTDSRQCDDLATVEKKPVRKRNALYDAISEAAGVDPSTAGSLIGAVAAALVKAEPPYTPDDVRQFAAEFGSHCPWGPEQGRDRPTPKEIQTYIGRIRASPATAASTKPPPKQMSFAAAAMARNDAILAAATGKTPELPPRETTPLAIENAK